jgi:antitoxin component of RelBE/YafQ-DinJ toxin-antitoxin module
VRIYPVRASANKGENDVREHCVLNVKVPHDLRAAIEREAAQTGLSLSDIVRIKLLNCAVAVTANVEPKGLRANARRFERAHC